MSSAWSSLYIDNEIDEENPDFRSQYGSHKRQCIDMQEQQDIQTLPIFEETNLYPHQHYIANFGHELQFNDVAQVSDLTQNWATPSYPYQPNFDFFPNNESNFGWSQQPEQYFNPIPQHLNVPNHINDARNYTDLDPFVPINNPLLENDSAQTSISLEQDPGISTPSGLPKKSNDTSISALKLEYSEPGLLAHAIFFSISTNNNRSRCV